MIESSAKSSCVAKFADFGRKRQTRNDGVSEKDTARSDKPFAAEICKLQQKGGFAELSMSIIIPTYNRAPILKKTLDSILAQTCKNCEIIIVDDGSSDDTEKTVQAIKTKSKIPLKYFKQKKNAGQGSARNRGIKEALYEICLLIGDDIIIDKKCIEEHLKTHKVHPEKNTATLGKIEWHPDLKLTPFMRFMTDGSCILGKYGGHQFAFEKLEGKEMADYNFFYTSNISLKTEILKKYPFDTLFQDYGWEDIDLGFRLEKEENLKIFYNKNAIGYHYHPLSEKSLRKRMHQIAKSAFIINKKYPELKKIPSKKKKLAFYLLSNPLSLLLFNVAKKIWPSQKMHNYYYYALSKKYYLEGLNSKTISKQPKI
ncbi:glycosyltransferase family 2 protein [Candidatus Peregrinibacteria bacterium]|nr:glycosyltransferase family 2 protein [Candidatus Peregrinibacteria bacterium]